MHVLPSTPVDRLRLYGVFFFFFAGFLYVIGGLVYRQLIQSNDLKEQSDTQSHRWQPGFPIKVTRGEAVAVMSRSRCRRRHPATGPWRPCRWPNAAARRRPG